MVKVSLRAAPVDEQLRSDGFFRRHAVDLRARAVYQDVIMIIAEIESVFF